MQHLWQPRSIVHWGSVQWEGVCPHQWSGAVQCGAVWCSVVQLANDRHSNTMHNEPYGKKERLVFYAERKREEQRNKETYTYTHTRTRTYARTHMCGCFVPVTERKYRHQHPRRCMRMCVPIACVRICGGFEHGHVWQSVHPCTHSPCVSHQPTFLHTQSTAFGLVAR